MIDSDDLLKLAKEGRPLSEQRAQLHRALLERGLEEQVVDAVLAETGAGIIFRETDEASGSRVGGAGSVRLPTGVAWPTSFGEPLDFLFEFDLSEIVGLSELPFALRAGTLLFFHDDEIGGWESYLSMTRVLFRGPDDRGVLTTEGAGYEGQPWGQRNLVGYASPLVDTGVDLREALVARFGDEEVRKFWRSLREKGLSQVLVHAQTTHRFLGPPAAFQNPVSEVIGYWFSKPEAEQDRQHFSEEELGGEGWSLLLQPAGISDAENGLDLEWHVEGERFFMIPTVDLEAGRFDRVITVFE